MGSNVFGLEGNSYSGKSTYLDVAATAGYFIVNEPSHFVRHFPDHRFRSQGEARANINFFLEVEKRRTEVMAERGERIGVMDRSLLTYIYFQYLVRKYEKGVPDAYEYAIDVFSKAISDHQVIFPSRLILLNVTDKEEYFRRIRLRGLVKETNLLANWSAYVDTYQWLTFFVSKMGENYGKVLNSPWEKESVPLPDEMFKGEDWNFDATRVINALQSMQIISINEA